jgi:hypothetical protein
MEEMVDDVLQMDDEEIEEEADAEVDKVLFELTDGKLGMAGSVSSELPVNVSSHSSKFLLMLLCTVIGRPASGGRDGEND